MARLVKNIVKIKKKLFFLFFATNILCQEIEEDSGALGVNIAIGMDVFSEKVFPQASLAVYGLSEEYEIRSELQIFTNFFYQNNFWQNRPFYNGIYAHSFGRLLVDYQILRYKIFQWQIGYLLGHQGFLYPTWEKAVYQVQVGFLNAFLLYFGDFFLAEIKFALPLGVYQHNHRQIFLAEAFAILYWQPGGYIRQVAKQNFLIGLGFQYDSISLSHKGQKYTQNCLRPFWQLTFFY